MTLSSSLAYRRLTFGPIPRDPTAPTDHTLSQWLAAQLAAPSTDAPAVATALAAVQLAFVDVDANGNPLPSQLLPLASINADEATLWAAMKAAGKDFAE